MFSVAIKINYVKDNFSQIFIKMATKIFSRSGESGLQKVSKLSRSAFLCGKNSPTNSLNKNCDILRQLKKKVELGEIYHCTVSHNY